MIKTIQGLGLPHPPGGDDSGAGHVPAVNSPEEVHEYRPSVVPLIYCANSPSPALILVFVAGDNSAPGFFVK